MKFSKSFKKSTTSTRMTARMRMTSQMKRLNQVRSKRMPQPSQNHKAQPRNPTLKRRTRMKAKKRKMLYSHLLSHQRKRWTCSRNSEIRSIKMTAESS